MRGLKRQQVAALTNFVGCFFFLALLLFFSPSALNDLAGPSTGLWPENHTPTYSKIKAFLHHFPSFFGRCSVYVTSAVARASGFVPYTELLPFEG